MAINVDSFFSHKAFAEKFDFNFALLSDFNREVVPNYVGYYPSMAGLKGVGRRAVFVVDRGGIIRYKWISEEEPGKIPDVDEVLQAAHGISG